MSKYVKFLHGFFLGCFLIVIIIVVVEGVRLMRYVKKTNAFVHEKTIKVDKNLAKSALNVLKTKYVERISIPDNLTPSQNYSIVQKNLQEATERTIARLAQ